MEKELVKALQTRLSELGWYSGDIDGLVGPMTENAVVDFKRSVGYLARPFVGPLTLTQLFRDTAPERPVGIVDAEEPYSWMLEAKRLDGVREKSGPANNSEIIGWARALEISYSGDDIPWCGLFVAHCIRTGLPNEKLGFNVLGARNWGKFGVAVRPQYGAILTFWRGSRDGWQGHVGFYVGEDDKYFYVLGGNQSDSVNVMKMAKDRLLESRFPNGVTPLGRTTTMSGGKVSYNEA